MIPQHGVADTIMTIRPLGPADAPAYRAQRLRALRDHPEAFGRTPEEVDAVEVWANTSARNPTPTATSSSAPSTATRSPASPAAAASAPSSIATRRTSGACTSPPSIAAPVSARRLFVAAVTRARTWPDLDSLWLNVTTTNHGARALYASCGFRTVGIKPRTLKVGDRYYDEELMMLDLGGSAA